MTRAGDKLYAKDALTTVPRVRLRVWRYVALAVLVGMAVGSWLR